MAKHGFYGREYVKTKDGDYDYQGQVNRLHNLRQWDRDETLAIAPQSIVSLDELQDRWNFYDWGASDNKHWEADVIRRIDEERRFEKERKLAREPKHHKTVHTLMARGYLNNMLKITQNW